MIFSTTCTKHDDRERHDDREIFAITETAYDAWIEDGKELVQKISRTQWEIGAWVERGEVIRDAYSFDQFRHGVYSAASQITGLCVATIKQYAYVFRSVPPSIQIDSLSFAHHQLVAPYGPLEQETYLEEMQIGGLTVGEARQRIKFLRGEDKPAPSLRAAYRSETEIVSDRGKERRELQAWIAERAPHVNAQVGIGCTFREKGDLWIGDITAEELKAACMAVEELRRDSQ
jgi:hypothetical protein